MRKLHAFVGITLIALVAESAMAADLPVSAPGYRAPVAVPVAYVWTGCYVGGNVGYGWARKSYFQPQLAEDGGAHTATGIVGGGQIGCDYQASNRVFGLQGMFDGADLRGDNVNPSSLYEEHTKVSWIATLTGRVGFLVQPSMLLYLKGGAAWVRDKHWETLPGTPAYNAVANVTRSGWTIGGGWEYLFWANWSAFVEYQFMDFGRRRVTLVDVLSGPFDYDIKQHVHQVVVGLNYRFNWGNAPVAARY